MHQADLSVTTLAPRRYLAFDRWIIDERKETAGDRTSMDGIKIDMGGPIKGPMGGPSRPKILGKGKVPMGGPQQVDGRAASCELAPGP